MMQSVKMLKNYGRWTAGERCGFTSADLKRIPRDCYEVIAPVSGGEASDMPRTLAPAKSEAESPTSEIAALEAPPQDRAVKSPRKPAARGRRKS